MRISCLAALFFAMTASVIDAEEAQWNQFRGPNGDGKTDTEVPVEFSETQNVRWKVAIPDDGWSSPVVWGNEIWLTTGSDEKRELRALCVDLETGKILKNIKVFDMIETPRVEAYPGHSYHLNSPATPTPVVEEGRIYVHFGSQGIACLDTNGGEKIWERRDLICYQPVRQGSSPIVDDEAVYVAYDGLDKQFFIALDKDTGETLWKMDRNVETDPELAERLATIKKPGDTKKSFATAQLIEVNGQTQVIAPAGEATMAYDPRTGEELWRVRHAGGFNVAARPLYTHGMIYVFTSGMTGHLLAVRVDGSGDVTDSHIAWTTTRGTPRIPSPVIVDDMMFLVTSQGVARCLDPKTGEQIWQKRIGGEYWASPLYANGQLYFSNKDGEVKVFPASREAPEIISNQLNGSFIASPAVVGNSLIMRSTSHLYRIQTGYERTAAEVAADAQSRRLASKAKGKSGGKKGAKAEAFDGDLQAAAARIKQAVAAGKITEEQAAEQYKALAARAAKAGAKQTAGSKNGEKTVDLAALSAKLKQAVQEGTLSEEDAMAKYQAAAGAGGNKGDKLKSKKK